MEVQQHILQMLLCNLPIAYAILGRCDEEILKPVDLVEIGNLEFRK